MTALRSSLLVVVLVALSSCANGDPVHPPSGAATAQQRLDGEEDGGFIEPELSTARLVRRVQLSLLGRPPTVEEVDAIDALATPEAREAAIAELIERDLRSPEFYKQSMKFAHDWFHVGAHNEHANISHGYFTGHLAIELQSCPMTSLHAGKLGFLNNIPQYGDRWAICDDPQATVNAVQPWWAPETMVQIIGRAGSATPQAALRTNGVYDCGVARVGDRGNSPGDLSTAPRCGCGPNLVYCLPSKNGRLPNSYTFEANEADSARRLASEEVARLYAHLVWQDRPLSDFLVGNYTVAPLWLKHMYVRAARFEAENASLDDSRWWDPMLWTTPSDPEHTPGSPLAWHEVVQEELHPNLLSLTAGRTVASGAAAMARSAKFDPRTEPASAFKGIPSAGALTTLVAQASFPRERVRAARWLETLTCRTFVPPPPTISFNDFRRDPATEGNCQHCHLLIDPAAVFFKRWSFEGNGVVLLGGFGRGSITATNAQNYPFVRWMKAFDPGTVMTPATDAQVAQNPNARFIDFLQPTQALFGSSGDGTYGPLGFGKILLESGEFDRCAVRQLYERFVGPRLDPGTHEAVIEALRGRFVAHERKVRPFVRELLTRPEFRKGL